MVDKMTVGKKIFALRKKKGITQENLAKLVNVTPQAISKWENGATLPDTCLLPTLAKLFNVSIEDLLCIHRLYDSIKLDFCNQVMLPGIKYHACIPPLVGCIKSSLDFLGIHVSTGWISAPYAFMLNINKEVSYMGPENWDDNGCFDELIRNCGGIVTNYGFHKSIDNITEKRKEAWDIVRNSIDKGLPCYAWEMDKPLYYMIAGYDKTGYYYIEHDSQQIAGPKPYNDLGDSDWGCLEIHVIRPGSISDNLKNIKDIFEYAINVGNPEIHAPNRGFTMGVEAYKVWWESILNGKTSYYGVAYNASFWAKCKNMATLFLQESKFRIGIFEDMFDDAITQYTNCAKKLAELSNLFSLNEKSNSSINEHQKEEAITLLKAAQKYEVRGLSKVNTILNEIYKIW